MNRRQRKKHRLGEFQELGFELRFCTPQWWSDEEKSGFWDACICHVEALGLSVAGGTSTCWDVYVGSLRCRGSVTPAQRAALLEWLEGHPEVTALQAGDLGDLWHERAPVRVAASSRIVAPARASFTAR